MPKLLPVKLITSDTPGVLPLEGDLTGKNLVIDPSRLKERMRFARNQIFLDVSGNGCKPHALGTKIFGKHLDGEESYWRTGDFIGIASDELVERAKLDKSSEKPVDLKLRVYMAVGPGYFGKGDTIEASLKALAKAWGKRSVKLGAKGVSVYRLHPEAYIDDWAMLRVPRGTTAEEVK